jgi:hypothetical protein
LLITKVLFTILYGDIGAIKPDSGAKKMRKVALMEDTERKDTERKDTEREDTEREDTEEKIEKGRIKENYLRTVMCVISKR